MMLLIPAASAYVLTGYAWPPDALPLEIHWTGTQPGFTHDELQAAIEDAAAAWSAHGACPFGITVVEDPAADAWFAAGGIAVLFGDPNGDVPDEVSWTSFAGAASGVSFTSGGRSYEQPAPQELVYNDVADWVSDDDIAAGACRKQFSLQGALTHAFGHLVGLGHSCEQGDACYDEGALEATMYWASETCDTSVSTLENDDVAGLEAIYGSTASFSFSCEVDAADPLTAACTITAPDAARVLSATWDFGDGANGSGLAASHSYAVAGTYDVTVCVEDSDCGDLGCDTRAFVAGAVEEEPATPPAEDTGCGCAGPAAGGSWFGVLLGLGAWARRRRASTIASAPSSSHG